MPRTTLCDRLDIEHPILNAPMGGTATAELAAAVSAAGGFGMIGGTSPHGPTWLREQIRAVRGMTDRPFGVGFISSFPGVDELVEVALAERVTAINHSFADPAPYVAAAHRAGVLLFAQVQTVAAAAAAARAGVDLIVAQGTEGGGHTGSVATLPLVPAVVDAVGDVPVVAAGGIADGRGLAAVLMLGAVGVSLGTRFLASCEWGGRAWEQQAVVAATADDTVRTTLYDTAFALPFPPGIAGRVLRNRFVEEWHGREAALLARRAELHASIDRAGEAGDATTAPVSAGAAAGLVGGLEPAGDIVRRIAAEADELLRRWAGRV